MSKTFLAVVGKGKKEFMLYTDIATHSSKFFQAALNRDWKEAKEKRVILADTRSSLFETYIQWLNTGVIVARFPKSMLYFTELYVLSDFLDDTGFADAVLDEVTTIAYEVWPGLDCVKLAWDKAPGGCSLQNLILEIWTKQRASVIAEELARHADDYPSGFMVDLVWRMAESGKIVSTPACCKDQFMEELREYRKGL